MPFWVDLAAAAYAIVAGFAKALSVLLTLRFLRKAPPMPTEFPPAQAGRPLVSVMKPVKGKDPGLYENLASFCQLEGISHEVVFCVANRDDPAVAVVEEVMKDFPGAPARLVVTGDRPGNNPKIMNLMGAWNEAKADLLLIADSNVRCPPDYLKRLTAPFVDPKVGCTYNLFMSRERGGTLGARLQALHFNSLVVSAMTGGYVLTGWANVIGKTMMLRRSAFAEIGGLEAFADILCEDAIIGRRLQKAGYQVVLVPQLGEAILGDMTLHHFWDHELRWSRLKRYTLGAVRHLTELFWNSTFNALVALALLVAGARAGATAVALAILLHLWSDALIWRAFNGRKRDAWLLPLVDLLRFLLIWISLFGRSVHWRGQIFHLGPETRILKSEPIFAPTSPAHALPEDRRR